MNTIIKIITTKEDKNLSYSSCTHKSIHTKHNREKIALKCGFNLDNLYYMNQIHSNEVKTLDLNKKEQECDGLITDKKEIILLVTVADCIPILFYDEIKGVIAAVHAGRNGTFMNISANCIDKMLMDYSCNLKDIKAFMGPSIHKCCYEVSSEILEVVEKNFGIDYILNNNIDLQGINKKQLLDKGILEKNIEISETCTKCNGKEKYFSYRNKDIEDRFGAIIYIK